MNKCRAGQRGREKVGHSNLDASSTAICSEGTREKEKEEKNKGLKSISTKEGMALEKTSKIERQAEQLRTGREKRGEGDEEVWVK